MSRKDDPTRRDHRPEKKRRRVALEGEAAEGARKRRPKARPIQEILRSGSGGATSDRGEVAGAERDRTEEPAWSPHRFEQFLRGQITLGDLEGITKEEQYEMANVGYSYLASGRIEPAKTVFEGLIALDPFDAYFHTALGAIAQQNGDLQEAEARYTRALEINPCSPTALAHRGEIRVLRGKLGDGSRDLVRALEEDPHGTHPATLRARATIQVLRDQLESAGVSASSAPARGRTPGPAPSTGERASQSDAKGKRVRTASGAGVASPRRSGGAPPKPRAAHPGGAKKK